MVDSLSRLSCGISTYWASQLLASSSSSNRAGYCFRRGGRDEHRQSKDRQSSSPAVRRLWLFALGFYTRVHPKKRGLYPLLCVPRIKWPLGLKDYGNNTLGDKSGREQEESFAVARPARHYYLIRPKRTAFDVCAEAMAAFEKENI